MRLDLPKEFWTKCINTLKADKNIFMLAETDSSWLYDVGFDAVYTWPEFNVMKNIVSGKSNALSLDSVINVINNTFPSNALLLYFTSNHDENSWNKADYGTMPGASHAPFAVLTQTLPRSIPLIYSGQEEPFLDSISFFYKDTIIFNKYARADFYDKLLELREKNNALEANAAFQKLHTNNDNNVYAFTRKNGTNKILVIVNLSNAQQQVTLNDQSVNGVATNLFTSTKENINNDQSITLNAWDYKVYVY